MDYEVFDCIDAGTEYCPCHLAETGDCILCSQLRGKNFCDCVNWKGVCIYQEYIWNGNKAKEERRHYLCNILEKKVVEKDIIIFSIEVSHKLAAELTHPGSYIFMRNPKFFQYYDTPISIMESDTEKDRIKVAIELKGTKTNSINLLKLGDKVLIRGPYWNGVLGLKNVYKTKNSNVLLVLRGIGQAPSMPVIKKLSSNGNKMIAIIDKSPCENIFTKNKLDDYGIKIYECKMLDKGVMTIEFKQLIFKLLKENEISLIHCAGPDILSYQVLQIVNDLIPMSCCNNAKMCCGEGVCGSCSIKTNDHKLRHLCKLQTDPKYILKGRRKL